MQRASGLPSSSGRTQQPSLLHRAAGSSFLGVPRPHRLLHGPHTQQTVSTSASAAFDASSGNHKEIAAQLEYKPFARRSERDPFKLLGISADADFEEVVDARNYLVELYKWHEESREAVEWAFDTIIKQKYRSRHIDGFRPARMGGRGAARSMPRVSPLHRITELFDTTISLTGLVNEGAPYAALAVWALFSLDQSFPLAGAFAFSVYKFQQKRVKAEPEGPYFGGNPIVGALLSTVINLALACGLMALLTTPLSPILGPSLRQVSACVTVAVMGLLAVYLR